VFWSESNFVGFIKLLAICKCAECVIWSIWKPTCLIEVKWCCDCYVWKTLISHKISLLLKTYKILFWILNMFVSDTLWLWDVEWWNACDLCMHACLLLLFLLPVIESNDTEYNEEGEVYQYQEEEGQGLANQGKPSILDAYLNPIHSLCKLHKGLLNCMFLYCYSSCSNYLLAQAP
jgi:hypothetical protein